MNKSLYTFIVVCMVVAAPLGFASVQPDEGDDLPVRSIPLVKESTVPTPQQYIEVGKYKYTFAEIDERRKALAQKAKKNLPLKTPLSKPKKTDEVIEETQPSSKRPPSKQKAKDQEEHHPKRLKEVTDNINEEIDENGFSEDVRHIIERVEKRAKENIVTSQTEFEELMANIPLLPIEDGVINDVLSEYQSILPFEEEKTPDKEKIVPDHAQQKIAVTGLDILEDAVLSYLAEEQSSILVQNTSSPAQVKRNCKRGKKTSSKKTVGQEREDETPSPQEKPVETLAENESEAISDEEIPVETLAENESEAISDEEIPQNKNPRKKRNPNLTIEERKKKIEEYEKLPQTPKALERIKKKSAEIGEKLEKEMKDVPAEERKKKIEEEIIQYKYGLYSQRESTRKWHTQLVKDLNSADPQVKAEAEKKREAIRESQRESNRKWYPQLVKDLNSNDEGVRQKAEERWEALRKSTLKSAQKNRDQLQEDLKSTNEEVRQKAEERWEVLRKSKLKSTQKRYKQLKEDLVSTNEEVRQKAEKRWEALRKYQQEYRKKKDKQLGEVAGNNDQGAIATLERYKKSAKEWCAKNSRRKKNRTTTGDVASANREDDLDLQEWLDEVLRENNSDLDILLSRIGLNPLNSATNDTSEIEEEHRLFGGWFLPFNEEDDILNLDFSNEEEEEFFRVLAEAEKNLEYDPLLDDNFDGTTLPPLALEEEIMNEEGPLNKLQEEAPVMVQNTFHEEAVVKASQQQKTPKEPVAKRKAAEQESASQSKKSSLITEGPKKKRKEQTEKSPPKVRKEKDASTSKGRKKKTTTPLVTPPSLEVQPLLPPAGQPTVIEGMQKKKPIKTGDDLLTDEERAKLNNPKTSQAEADDILKRQKNRARGRERKAKSKGVNLPENIQMILAGVSKGKWIEQTWDNIHAMEPADISDEDDDDDEEEGL